MAKEASERFHIADMDCPSCVQKIQGRLLKLDGVLQAEGSSISRTLTVELDRALTDRERIREEVGRLGYVARSIEGADAPPQPLSTWRGREARIAYTSIGLFGLAMLLKLAGGSAWTLPLPFVELPLPDVVLVASALVGGWNFFPKGARAARFLALDMNFLMTLAILGAIGIGEFTEAAAIAFLFALAELLESYSVDRARASVEALMELAPDSASVLRNGSEVRIPADEIVVGDLVMLRPGERIPADGMVDTGTSAVDQSTITGESIPVDKGPGDEVFSGTMNREGFLTVQVTRLAADSTLASIVRLIVEAESEKSPSERFVERFARYYTPAVTIAAILVVAVPTLLLGAPFEAWFVRGLTLLVIACPCALVIATPVAVVSGVTAAARNGVLIKGGTYLEAMGAIEAVAVDKTGTLTLGRPRVVEVRPVGGASELEVLSRAAAIEAQSEHPIAQAIVEAAVERGAVIDTRAAVDFSAEPGSGARGWLDGVEYVVGKPSFVVGEPEGRELAHGLAAGGRTVVGLASGGEVLAWFALADEPREGAADTVGALRAAGVRHVVMLTGDNRETAEAVARRVGIEEVREGLLPAEKVDAVKALAAEYGSVAMVGDGVNDGPALATATVGIAMGAAGSDTALETADVALMGDDLTRLPYLYKLSRRARWVIRQNIFVAIAVKAVLALAVPVGLVSLVTAVVVGDMGVSLAVTLNALRLGNTEGA
jgi:Cd2+/Zn2+-exporting ATPase